MSNDQRAVGPPPDLVIRNGWIVDGRGPEPYRSDLALAGGRVVAIERELTASRALTIDATGLTVAPGFVDVHTHADLLPFLSDDETGLRLGGLLQGVTTLIAGNCGFSVFPSPEGEQESAVREHLAALFGPGAVTFPDLDAYRKAVESEGLDSNLASLVGQGTLRATVAGFDDRPVTAAELETMRLLTHRAMEQGAAGLSTGLLYPPGSFAGTDELVALATVAAGWDRPYVSHIRNEMDLVLEALSEALEIGRTAGARVQVSHLKAAGTRNHGRLGELLDLLDEARGEGLDVSADAYPYERASTVLHALLPPWATEGGVDVFVDRLGDSRTRERLAASFASTEPDWQNFLTNASWESVTIASAPNTPALEGRTVSDLAAEAGKRAIDFVADLLISDRGSVTVTVEAAAHDDVTRCLASSGVMVGSDGIPTPGKPHPRWAGSFARVLSPEGRERFGLTVVEAVAKMSVEPAGRFGLDDRGVIQAGGAADIVVFDADAVRDQATYDNPLATPTGIEHVIVNGHRAVAGGSPTGIRAGRFVTPAKRHALESNRRRL